MHHALRFFFIYLIRTPPAAKRTLANSFPKQGLNFSTLETSTFFFFSSFSAKKLHKIIITLLQLLRYSVDIYTYIFLKKKQNTPRPSEHPPVMGEKMSKRLGGIKRLQIQNLFMTFKQVPRCRLHWVHSIMSGRNPPLYCTFTLIAMQGHQKNIKSKPETK